MANVLITKLNTILNEKINKIVPGNIKKGVQIFDVTGTLEPGIDTSDATAVAGDIAFGKIAYVNGEKIEGNLPLSQNILNYTGSGEIQLDESQQKIAFKGTAQQTTFIAGNEFQPVVNESYSALASAIGLTADKIKAGETILGITGTYTEQV